MSKVLLSINLGPDGSTGKIVRGIHQEARKEGFQTFFAYPKQKNQSGKEKNDIWIISYWWNRILNKFAYLTGAGDRLVFFHTLIFLIRVRKIKPDIIHLHNIHGFFLNYQLFFKYIKKHNVRVVWTLHDCWAFTGRCPYFDISGCNKWMNGCLGGCSYPQKAYPNSGASSAARYWSFKKKSFSGVLDMTIVTPSKWLAELTTKSFLSQYHVEVIYNGIDLSIFKPTEGSFRSMNKICPEKFVILGVAFDWGYRKGIDIFMELEHRLPKDQYQIVLVGTNDDIDKQFSENVISVHRTNNQQELAEIYSAADLFVNPTREEVLGMVNLEALACGTPVITFNTGGSPECIDDTCGVVMSCNDIDSLESEIERIHKERPFSRDDCIARAKLFDINTRFPEYVQLYRKHENLTD